MGLLARIFRPSGPTHGRPPFSFSLSPASRVPMVTNLIKQAPRGWYSGFSTYLRTLGFTEARLDTPLFIFHHGSEML
jgi:hypothetical protein